MAYVTVRDLPPLVNSSGSSVVTAGIGNLDDANSIMVYLSTANNVLSSNVSVEVAQFDPGVGFGPTATPGATQSSAWYPIFVGTSLQLTSGAFAFTISPVAFRGLRIRTSANSITTGTTIAFATKQISV